MTTLKILIKKYFSLLQLITLTIPFLICCNQTPKKEIPGVPYNPEDYVQTKLITVPQTVIDTTEPFLIAKGNGKDWHCYFYAYKIRFLYNNGKDSFNTRADFEYYIRNKIILNPMTIGVKTDKFNIEIDPDHDYESMGQDSSRVKKIIITLDKKTYEGYVTQPIN
jgi:hypothetical protein